MYLQCERFRHAGLDQLPASFHTRPAERTGSGADARKRGEDNFRKITLTVRFDRPLPPRCSQANAHHGAPGESFRADRVSPGQFSCSFSPLSFAAGSARSKRIFCRLRDCECSEMLERSYKRFFEWRRVTCARLLTFRAMRVIRGERQRALLEIELLHYSRGVGASHVTR